MRRAVLDAAGELFARRGVDQVSLRDIAAAADVQLGLIARYIGSRDDLVQATFDDLSRRVAATVTETGRGAVSFEPDSDVGRWTRLLAGLVLGREELPDLSAYNPVEAIAAVAREVFGADDRTARIRAAQALASAIGWRLLEDYLVAAGDLGDEDIDALRSDLNAVHQRLAATPFPTELPEGP